MWSSPTKYTSCGSISRIGKKRHDGLSHMLTEIEHSKRMVVGPCQAEKQGKCRRKSHTAKIRQSQNTDRNPQKQTQFHRVQRVSPNIGREALRTGSRTRKSEKEHTARGINERRQNLVVFFKKNKGVVTQPGGHGSRLTTLLSHRTRTSP
jgi:hypothetical protein